jgi:hypothetical protein
VNSVSGDPPGCQGNRMAGTQTFSHFTFQQFFSSVTVSVVEQHTSQHGQQDGEFAQLQPPGQAA